MQLTIEPGGIVHAVYDEAIDLAEFGPVTIRRASHCEPDEQGRWWVDLSPVSGPVLGPFHRRTEALRAEHQWLNQHLPLVALAR